MSNDTPMSYCKDQFKSFKELAENFGFDEITLNKSSYSSTFVGSYQEGKFFESKGVKSDFIKLYKLKFSGHHYHHLGFEFKYINIPKEDFKIIVSLKSNVNNLKSFKTSEALSVDDFLLQFNQLLNQKEDIKSYRDLLNKMSELFLPKPKNKFKV